MLDIYHQILIFLSTLERDYSNNIHDYANSALTKFMYINASQNQLNFINKAVVARDKQNIIGTNGTIYWDLPEDLKNFRLDTLNAILIMGKTTYYSLHKDENGFMLPLPKRLNIVVSRHADQYYSNQLTNIKPYKRLIFVESLWQAQALSILLNLNQEDVLAIISHIYSNSCQQSEIAECIERLWQFTFNELPTENLTVATIGGEFIYDSSMKNFKSQLLPLNQIILTEVATHLDTPKDKIKKFTFDENLYIEDLSQQKTFNGTNDPLKPINCVKKTFNLKRGL
ncbi:dihydrofolate reductase [Psittacicella hinzii]|uniref:dihydrofolate reductase n=1 Tax=Psittacicella hinzii TaxID=2028575 RepID=A0A3A1YBU9_9GAMM|nr:dihydrofolate reductase [Psittacicella hinzii]RIY34650.1 hypothetical protein CKF58_07935 [Psittacicella hinzii]